MRAQFSEYNPETSIQRVRLSKELTALSMLHYMNGEDSKQLRIEETEFKYVLLSENDKLYGQLVEDLQNYDIHKIRIHEFLPEHKATPHFDSAFPTLDTIIIRLDAGKESRLKIEGKLVKEFSSFGYLLPKGTMHEIIPGKGKRYSLVIWCRKK